VRSAVIPKGAAMLTHLDFLGADVEITDAVAGDEVVVRTRYYPAWTASANGTPVALYDHDGQLAFRAPAAGTYTVALAYPRRPWLSLGAIAIFVVGLIVLRGR